MTGFLGTWLVDFLSLWVLDHMMTSIWFFDWEAILVTSFVLAVLTKTVKPILQILSLPITVVTLGLFYLVINTIILLIAFHISHSYIAGFGSAFIASILLSILNSLIGTVLGVKK